MSDEGDRTCPLCAEEMDLTDQQLKPCKCGYEICVWCWHHIMGMAEKDETEGRCPACRTPYNKERIVGMAAGCEKLVAEWNIEKKHKSHKGKSKTSEGRKQLSSVRVIQRNLVYIVGLPLNLADEDLLQRKEYFGQYGKVLKVSISRTAAGAIQHFANNTCSVYITYSKEDEAVRCIQSVHGYVLEGRPLRACFGTTKYCHAWLRNVPCSNPDCLYLHEIGSQEDSFTKDEIISAYTRSRVQQTTGVTNSTQRRSGNVLPPPADDYCINGSASTGKPISKSATNNSANNVRISPPNSSSGRSVGLPAGALWGTRGSNNNTPATVPSSNGPVKQKTDASNGPVTFSAAVASPNQVPPVQSSKKQTSSGETVASRIKVESLDSLKKYSDEDTRATTSETNATAIPPATSTMNSHLPSSSKEIERTVNLVPNSTNTFDPVKSGEPGLEKKSDESTGQIQTLCSTVSSISNDSHNGLQEGYNEQFGEPVTSQTVKKASDSADEVWVRKDESRATYHEIEDDVVAFNNQRHRDPEVVTDRSYLPNRSHSFHLSNHSSGFSQLNSVEGSLSLNVNLQTVDNNINSLVQGSNIPVVANGYPENQVSRYDTIGNSVEHLFPKDGKRKQVERSECEAAGVTRHDGVDIGESSIISNILSLDLDPWDEPLTSPQNFVKLLGDTNNQQASVVSSSRRVHNSNQSRFSFAREEEPINQASYVEPSLSYIGNASQTSRFSHDFSNDRAFQFDKFSTLNGFSLVNHEESDILGSSHSYSTSNKLSVSRSQISAPPGFSTPSRAPPPGFTSHERVEQSFDPFSGHHMLDTSSLLRDQYQASQVGNIVSSGDIEFMDPAILAVGKGRLPSGINGSGLDMRSSFSPQYSTFENEARLQSLMQRSVSPHQNQRFADIRDTYTPLNNNNYGIPNRVMDHAFTNNLSPFSQLNFPHSRTAVTSNGHWDGWNESQSGNDLALAELLRNERLGFNKFYAGYEDTKFRMPSSGDLYNRTFGM